MMLTILICIIDVICILVILYAFMKDFIAVLLYLGIMDLYIKLPFITAKYLNKSLNWHTVITLSTHPAIIVKVVKYKCWCMTLGQVNLKPFFNINCFLLLRLTGDSHFLLSFLLSFQ